MSLNTLTKTNLTQKWLGEKLIYQRKCRRVGRSLIIVNKSVQETENLLLFSSVGSNFISLMNTQTLFSLVAIATLEKSTFGVHSVK